MKQRDFKKQIITDLHRIGYHTFNDQLLKKIGVFSVIIHLSTRPSVLIETCGTGKHYIVLKRTNFGRYSDVSANEIIDQFNEMVSMCNNFYSKNERT